MVNGASWYRSSTIEGNKTDGKNGVVGAEVGVSLIIDVSLAGKVPGNEDAKEDEPLWVFWKVQASEATKHRDNIMVMPHLRI